MCPLILYLLLFTRLQQCPKTWLAAASMVLQPVIAWMVMCWGSLLTPNKETSRGLQMSRPRSRIFVLYNCLWNFMWLENLSEIPYVQVWITIRWFHVLFFLPSRKKWGQKGMNPTFHLPNVKLWRGDAAACWVVQLPRQPYSTRQVVCMGPV